MNREAVTIGGHRIKAISSCVRAPRRLYRPGLRLVDACPRPREGDMVLCRAAGDTGAYDHVEDLGGAPVRIYERDVVLLVLGSRRSGTNLMGEVPEEELRAGERLHLVAQGGLAARCTSIPAYYAGSAMPFEIVGFVSDEGGNILNLADDPPIPVAARPGAPAESARLVLVVGTSAETGKTTAVCNLNIALKRRWPAARTAAIKACGTGRAKDRLSYAAANYDLVSDFVDCGYPSTYGMAEAAFRPMLLTLVGHAARSADLIVVEVGGDFLEGHAPAAIEIMTGLGAACIMMVSDAMGALEGLRRLTELGRRPTMIGTYRQNLHALALRLNLDPALVADTEDRAAMDRLAERLLDDEPHGRASPHAAGAVA
jgi:hypothetical protein